VANAYTQIHIQAVFAVHNRDCIIQRGWKDEGRFSWPKGWYGRQVLQGSTARRQEGDGAFSYSKSDLPNVIQYIENQ